jgi:hypothetical protein
MARRSRTARVGRQSMAAEIVRPSRRTLVFSVVGLVALADGALMLSGSKTALAQQKVSQEQAKYQDSPKGDQKCSNCTFFVEPNTCKTVEGDISPEGWCQLWVEKQ